MTTNGLTAAQHALALPEIVQEIFSWLQVLLPENQGKAIKPGIRRLLSCARVNHTWHYITTQTIWRDIPMLSYTFTKYVRKSPNRQALANCVRCATYDTLELYAEKRYLSGLEFSRLHTLTIQISITPSSSCWVGRHKHNYSYISDIDLLPLIKCPALLRLNLWHKTHSIFRGCAVGALPEIWMRYLRSILVSLTQSCCSF